MAEEEEETVVVVLRCVAHVVEVHFELLSAEFIALHLPKHARNVHRMALLLTRELLETALIMRDAVQRPYERLLRQSLHVRCAPALSLPLMLFDGCTLYGKTVRGLFADSLHGHLLPPRRDLGVCAKCGAKDNFGETHTPPYIDNKRRLRWRQAYPEIHRFCWQCLALNPKP